MVGLLDIAPSTQTIRVAGAEIAVYGVSAKGVASLFHRFPALRKAFAGKDMSADFTAEKLVELVPEAIAAIIAAGCGHPGDPEAEKVAERLPVAEQAEALEVILKLTMPQGVGPFVDRINRLRDALSAESGKVRVTKSPSPVKR